MNKYSISVTHVVAAGLASVLVACVAGACSPARDASSAARDCNFVNYHHDEAKNAAGAGKCATDCDCDGMRTCAGGTCQGTARPATTGPSVCNNKDYRWNEAWNPQGAGRCANDCECDGLRTCTAGTCQGTAR